MYGNSSEWKQIVPLGIRYVVLWAAAVPFTPISPKSTNSENSMIFHRFFEMVADYTDYTRMCASCSYSRNYCEIYSQSEKQSTVHSDHKSCRRRFSEMGGYFK